MRKILLMALSAVILINCTCFRTEASNKAVFDKAQMDESFVKLLQADSDLLLEQYSNIIDIQVVTLSKADRSNGSLAEAYEYDENGAVRLLEVEATLTKVLYWEDFGSRLSDDENISALYVLTADTKDSSDSITQGEVTLNGTITWIDHFGIDNELVSLSGSRSGLYTGDATYDCYARTRYIGGSTFGGISFADSSFSGTKGYSFSLIVRSTSSVTGKQVQLLVKTSAFD